MPPDLTLVQLSYVVAVDTHGHFGRAAEACGVTQPTLSMQLRKLERALGVVLFDRSRAPVVATDLGRRIVEQARVTLREAARLGELRDEAAGAVSGELRLGVIPTLAPYLLPRFLGDLAARWPALELVVEERLTDELLDGLRRETLDAALLATPVPRAEFVERPLFVEPFVGYVSPGHRLAGRATLLPADLRADDLWLLAEGHCFREQAVAACAQRRGRRATAAEPTCVRVTRFESGNLETLKRLVERGEGMTLLPALAAAELTPALRAAHVRPFAEPAPSRTVSLVRRRAYLKRALVDAVVACLTAALPGDVRAP